MTNQEMNTVLYKRMFEEHEAFKEELMKLPAEEILKQAYEYTVREDILFWLEVNDLSPKQCRALLKEENIMDKLFYQFESQDSNYMEYIGECIEQYANSASKLHKQNRGDAR